MEFSKKFDTVKSGTSIIYYAGSMGVSFQDYSWIQDFEADFP